MSRTPASPAGVTETVTLASGRPMPALGLGTWQLTGEAAAEGARHALELGYRLIDTSGDYGNQPKLAEGIAAAPVDREEVFLVTKVEEDEDAYASTAAKLEELGTDRVDLCLLHRPPPDGAGEDLWDGLIRAKHDGLADEIGVSNYRSEQLDRLIEVSDEAPAVNQVEWSPFGHSAELMHHAREHGVVIQAYCPLTRGERLDDEAVTGLADDKGVTPAQILLRWSIQSGAAPVPKAATPEHRAENLGVFDFELDPEEMRTLTGLNEHYSALAGLPYV